MSSLQKQITQDQGRASRLAEDNEKLNKQIRELEEKGGISGHVTAATAPAVAESHPGVGASTEKAGEHGGAATPEAAGEHGGAATPEAAGEHGGAATPEAAGEHGGAAAKSAAKGATSKTKGFITRFLGKKQKEPSSTGQRAESATKSGQTKEEKKEETKTAPTQELEEDLSPEGQELKAETKSYDKIVFLDVMDDGDDPKKAPFTKWDEGFLNRMRNKPGYIRGSKNNVIHIVVKSRSDLLPPKGKAFLEMQKAQLTHNSRVIADGHGSPNGTSISSDTKFNGELRDVYELSHEDIAEAIYQSNPTELTENLPQDGRRLKFMAPTCNGGTRTVPLDRKGKPDLGKMLAGNKDEEFHKSFVGNVTDFIGPGMSLLVFWWNWPWSSKHLKNGGKCPWL